MKRKPGTLIFAAVRCFAALVIPMAIFGQGAGASSTPAEKAIIDQLRHLRSLADDVRTRTTRQLALDIRALPKTAHKVDLATDLANLSTEGDFGHDTLQDVATTLAEALVEQPQPINE